MSNEDQTPAEHNAPDDQHPTHDTQDAPDAHDAQDSATMPYPVLDSSATAPAAASAAPVTQRWKRPALIAGAVVLGLGLVGTTAAVASAVSGPAFALVAASSASPSAPPQDGTAPTPPADGTAPTPPADGGDPAQCGPAGGGPGGTLPKGGPNADGTAPVPPADGTAPTPPAPPTDGERPAAPTPSTTPGAPSGS